MRLRLFRQAARKDSILTGIPGPSLRAKPTRLTAVSAVALALVVPVTIYATRQTPASLHSAGIAEQACKPSDIVSVPPGVRGAYIPDSNVLVAGNHVYLGAAEAGSPKSLSASAQCVASDVGLEHAWLAAGAIPGENSWERSMATRALLDLRLLVRPNGAVEASSYGVWQYAWPRDSSWVAAALAATGHTADAFRILRFLREQQSPDGTWAARSHPDGSGAVQDGRPPELDAVGWVPWAAWSWFTAAERASKSQADTQLALVWPMIVSAADAADASLTADDLPVASMDYWEDQPIGQTIETAAALLAGLRAAADLAAARNDTALSAKWAAAAVKLSAGVERGFVRSGFHRTAFSPASGVDAAITILGPPFSAPSTILLQSARTAQEALTMPNGGLRPGTSWHGSSGGVSWTPETAFFALFDAETGQRGQADTLLAWLYNHRTVLGELPEQVGSSGQPLSVAPLAWTDSIVLLALVAQGTGLPTVPDPEP